MKRIILTIVLIACLCLPVVAQNRNIYARPNSRWLEGSTLDPLWAWLKWADAQIAGASSVGDNDTWYVNSNVTNEGDGSNWANARDTLDEAIDLAAANDLILVAAGHAESGSAANLWDADVAGITIRHLGNGSTMGTYTFADTDTTVSVGAANVTIIGGRLLAGIDEVVIGMDVTADADYLAVIGMEFPEPTTSTFEFNIAVQLVTGADDVSFIGCKAYSADDTGADHWLNGGAGVVNRLTLVGNIVHGEFLIAPIFSDQADLECYIAGNTVTNMTTVQLGIEFSGNATGWIANNLVSTDAIGTSYDMGRMSDSDNKWDDFNVYDTTAVPWTTNETGVNRWGATELAQIEGEATDALEADDLDHLINVAAGTGAYPIPTANDSIVAMMLAKGATATISTYNNTTDSQEAIRDAIDAITGVGFRGDATSAGGTATFISTDMTGFGDDYFNTNWQMILVFDAGSAGAAPEGDIRDIVDYESSTGTFTVAPVWSGAQSTASGDKAFVVRDQDLNPHDVAILGGSDKITYVDSARAGTPDVGDLGDTWDLAYLTITAALDAAVVSGEVIYVAPGHSETLTSAYAIDDAGVSIIGFGEGSLQPLLTLNHVDAQLDITVADVLIQNIRIESQLDNVKIGIDISGTGDGTHIKNCNFTNETASDELLIAINLTTGSDDVIVEGCTFLSVGAASTECIKAITGACDNLQILNNWIRGDYTVAAIWSDQALTDVLIRGNIVQQETASEFAVEFTSTTLGSFDGNRLYSDDYASMLDPGSMLCTDNWGVDILDQQAIRIPLSAETSDVTEVSDGSDLERLEYLQNLSSDALALLDMGSAGHVFYCDSGEGTGTEDGLTWATATDTLEEAIQLCTANRQDTIFVAAGHVGVVGVAAVDLDIAGVRVIGLGNGDDRPTWSATAGSDTFILGADGDNCMIKNLKFIATVDSVVVAVQVEAGCENFVIDGCSFEAETGGTDEFDDVIIMGAAADRGLIQNCRFLGNVTSNADPQSCINFVDSDYTRIIDNEFYGDRAVACIENAGTASNHIVIQDNILFNGIIGGDAGLNTVAVINLKSDTTGMIIGNTVSCNVGIPELSIVAADCYLFDNLYNETDGGNSQTIGLRAGETYALTKIDGIAGDDDLFLVANGGIMITHFHGYIDTDIGGATTMKIFLDHTDKDYDFTTAVDIQAGVDGGQVLFSAANPAVLSIVGIGAVGSGLVSNPWYCEAGSIESDSSDANTTGNIKWSMTFIPLTDGVTVTIQ